MIHALTRRAPLLSGLLFVAGCVAPSTPAPQPRVTPKAPTFSTVGLEAVMGSTASALEAQLGKPQLDVTEGTARKLQFASSICVLDAYLYPPAKGGDAVVTYVDARQPDGRDVDRASCVAALISQQQVR